MGEVTYVGSSYISVTAYTGGEDPKALAKAARAALPRYMVPNLYHPLETMPHNPNGKIDRLTYYISVKPEDVERAKELLADLVKPEHVAPQ